MLARLDDIPGVAESRVDWSGRRFLLQLDGGASRSGVAAQAADVLGTDARRIDGLELREVVDSYRGGETWMRAGESLELSRFEAGVLAQRHGGEAARAIGLDAEGTQRLVELCREELERAFERAHEGRGIEDLPGEFEAAAARILAQSADVLGPQQHAALAAWLAAFARPR